MCWLKWLPSIFLLLLENEVFGSSPVVVAVCRLSFPSGSEKRGRESVTSVVSTLIMWPGRWRHCSILSAASHSIGIVFLLLVQRRPHTDRITAVSVSACSAWQTAHVGAAERLWTLSLFLRTKPTLLLCLVLSMGVQPHWITSSQQSVGRATLSVRTNKQL